MSEEECDQSLRPLAIYPCGDRDCAPHWVEQEWQQVNTLKSQTATVSLLFDYTVVTEVILTTFLRTILVLRCGNGVGPEQSYSS